MGRVDLVVRREELGAFHESSASSNARFERLFALKRPHPALLAEPEYWSMFLDEARIAGMISHPNAIGVVDLGQDEEGPYLLMDYVEGVSLSRLMRRVNRLEEQVPLQVALRIIAQAARGLHAAHEQRDTAGNPLEIVHRDISPHNLIVGYDGVVRVMDFGIAKAMGRMSKTATGALKGKFSYMAPEQLLYQNLDRRADLFSLGVVFFELLSGATLYGGGEISATARRILEEPPPDIDDYRQDTPPEVVSLLLRLLAKSPQHRTETAAQVADELEPLINEIALLEGPLDVGEYCASLFEEDRRARAETVATRLSEIRMDLRRTVMAVEAPKRRARRLAWAGGAVLLIATVGVAAALTWPWSAQPDAPAPTDSWSASNVPPKPDAQPARVPLPDDIAPPGDAPEAASAEPTSAEPTSAAEAASPEDAGAEAAPAPRPARRRVRRRRPRRRPAPSRNRSGGDSPLFVGYGAQ